MADPLPPFTLILMMLIFKKVSLHISTTFSFSHTNNFSIPFLYRVPFFKYFHPFVLINYHTMTPAKGQSSSRRKGKKIVSDPSATHDEGKEAVYSELDSFDKEDAASP